MPESVPKTCPCFDAEGVFRYLVGEAAKVIARRHEVVPRSIPL